MVNDRDDLKHFLRFFAPLLGHQVADGHPVLELRRFDDVEQCDTATRCTRPVAGEAQGLMQLLAFVDDAKEGSLRGGGLRVATVAGLQVVSSVVQKLSGTTPVIYIREGKLTDEMMALLEEQSGVSVLVLGAAAGAEGPGRLISHVLKRIGKLPLPVTIVPGGLEDEEIDAIS